jgi:hypothetical protein
MARKTVKKAKGHTGRRTLLTPEMREKILGLIKNGNYIETACSICEISPTTWHVWRNKGEAELERIAEGGRPLKSQEPYREFVIALTRAEAEAEGGSVLRIQQLARDAKCDARVRLDAEKFLLERRFRDRWGRSRVDIDLKSTGTVEHSGEVKTTQPLTFLVPIPEGMADLAAAAAVALASEDDE